MTKMKKKTKAGKEDVLDKMRRLADKKGLTQKDILKICREVRKEVYEEDYGKASADSTKN
ncbi:MAG: hypothetical protein WCX64_05565 [Candidatus Micrarchaeia archaeon]|jgi:chorismate mutase